MRIHRLELAAFGPFRHRQRIDLDTLSQAGLFLLHGSTGAGKSSVLDAVCFALYGRVPGARAQVTRLRSDHAGADEAPEVVCEFSVGPRRFDVTRSPAWERPKRRGGGTTTAQARVLLRERVDGEWQVRATRIDEAAHLLDDVLGMGPDQFTKLVMLPQGEFAAFLRADAESRRALLERLFETDRFTAVQSWLRDHRSSVRAEVETAHRWTAHLLARADQVLATLGQHGEATGTSTAVVPVDAPDPAEPDTDGTESTEGTEDSTDATASLPAHPAARLARQAATVDHLRTEAFSAELRARDRLERAEMRFDQAQAMAQLAADFEVLTTRQERLDRERTHLEQVRAALVRARQAQVLVPLVPGLDAARGEVIATERARTTAERALTEAGVELGDGDAAGALDRRKHELREALTRLSAVQEEVDGRRALERSVRELDHACAELETERAAAASQVEDAASALAEHTAAARHAEAAIHAVPAATTALAHAEQVLGAVTARDASAAPLRAVRDALEQARATANEAKACYLDLRERRLEALAGELAATLVDGRPCRVCGSTCHPAPAARTDGAADAEAEESARLAAEAADGDVARWQAEQARLQAEADAARRSAGDLTAQAAQITRDEALRHVAELRREAAEHDRHRAAAAAAHAAHRAATARLASADAARTSTLQRRAAAEAQLDGLRERIRQACDGEDDADVRLARFRVQLDRLTGLRQARARHRAAVEHRATIGEAATSAAIEAGFADLDLALAAVLPAERVASLEREVIDHQVEWESVHEQLTDERFTTLHTGTAAVLDPAGLAQLADDVEHALAQLAAAIRRSTLCDNAFDDLTRLQTAFGEHLARTTPVVAQFRELDDLTRCVDGTGGDNAKRMTLSAYVLASRLEQVAAAATIRLSQMSGGRYALVHSAAGERGRLRSGLSLEVLDAWTGSRRETSTLSGGESFYTSLALALGLADVVTAEAGGVGIETLFIDEGFGSLDDETLDEVMEVLDGLRAGGRAVGVVSHLSELRQRIATRLEVRKSPHGSTVRAIAG